MKQNKELKKLEKESKKSAKIVKKALTDLAPKTIDESDYISKGYSAERSYSVFSTLDILNKNNDLFKFTKNTVSTVLKTILSAEEISNLMDLTNCSNFEVFTKKVHSALNGKNNNATINGVASSVAQFLRKVQKQQAETSDDKNFEAKHLESTVEKRASGPHNLVNQVTTVYGTNRYLDVNMQKLQMAPLYAKLDSDVEGIKKVSQTAEHIKNVYGYNLSYSQRKNPLNVVNRTIRLTKYEGKLDSCVNMLYSVAKTLTGSKKVKLSRAKNMLSKEEHNDFLNAKGLVKKYDSEKVSKIFSAHKNTIKDVVSTFTTIFMARFLFEAPVFAEIEKDLTEQACVKMKSLRISDDANEDYWINQLIEDRLKVNINQVLTANNITSAEQLIKIYNKNGTVIVNPEKVTCLEDLVFALQYNEEKLVENKKLENLQQSVFENLPKPTIKAKEFKVSKQKPNKYLDEVIRKSEKYQQYLEMYRNRLQDLNLDFTNAEIESKLSEINNNLETSLEQIEELAKSPKLSEEAVDKITNMTAKHDAIEEVLNVKQEQKEIKPVEELTQQKSQANSQVSPAESFANANFVDDHQISMNEYLQDSNQEIPDSLQKENNVDLIENDEKDSVPETFIVESSDYQLTIDDILNSQKAEQTLSEKKESSLESAKTYQTSGHLGSMTDENIKKKIKKYYEKLVYGQNGKVGVIGDLLNYRLIEKSSKKTTYASDNERLDDKDLNRANKIRDEKASFVVDAITDSTFKFYNKNKEACKNLTVVRLCINKFREQIDVDETTPVTSSDIKKCLSVWIANVVNEELKDYNIELYTGKKTYKMYYKKVAENANAEELEEK
ncbi:MAG: hypothetical protein ACI4TI_03415 [Christensenellales bacterium]